jgi:carboxyl-terminal processing protease
LTARQPDGRVSEFVLGFSDRPESEALVTSRMLSDVGYLRIENSLGDADTISEFDAALAGMAAARGLILDLRNTPSGGGTDVAEPILGRFIAVARPYQRVFDPRTDAAPWNKIVTPRSPHEARPLVVLVDHWTGSMGEGMAVGLDALGRAVIVGTPMAGLKGGISSVTLPRTRVAVRFPTERLFHTDGTPRHLWRPPIVIQPRGGESTDPIIEAGLRILSQR